MSLAILHLHVISDCQREALLPRGCSLRLENKMASEMFDEEDLFGVFDQQQIGQTSASKPERKAHEEARSTTSISRKRATPVVNNEVGNGDDEDLGPRDDNDEAEEGEENQERRKGKRQKLDDPDLEYALISFIHSVS